MRWRKANAYRTSLDQREVYLERVPAGPAAAGGPPLLLIHGISCSAGTWSPFTRELAAREDAPELLVPELPAHGRSAPSPRVRDMADLAEWAERLLRDLEAPVVDVMGHSMGCQVAVALAQRHPERVGRVVLLGPTTGGRVLPAYRSFAGLLADSALEPPAYNRRLLRVFLRLGLPRYLRTVREMQRDDALSRARRVDAPSLVLRGERDAIIPESVAHALAAALPGGDYETLPAAAHAAQFSHPAATASRVLAFLGRAAS